MKINKVSDEVVYVEINGWVYNIDDSTGEKIVERWPADRDIHSDMEKDNYIAEWFEYGHNVPGYYRKEEESDDYDELLAKLREWRTDLSTNGPRHLIHVQEAMDDYLEQKHGDPNTKEWLERGLPEPEPCIDFDHQKGYK